MNVRPYDVLALVISLVSLVLFIIIFFLYSIFPELIFNDRQLLYSDPLGNVGTVSAVIAIFMTPWIKNVLLKNLTCVISFLAIIAAALWQGLILSSLS